MLRKCRQFLLKQSKITGSDFIRRKMYVARIESWGLGKNCTKKRVLDFHGKNNERVHNSKIVKLGGEGKVIDEKRIQNYLKRKNKDIELGAAENIVYSDAEISPETSTSTDSNSGPSEIHTNSSLRSSSTESSKNENYEVFCPYLPWKKKFRLIEDFPKYTLSLRLSGHVTDYSLVAPHTKETH